MIEKQINGDMSGSNQNNQENITRILSQADSLQNNNPNKQLAPINGKKIWPFYLKN